MYADNEWPEKHKFRGGCWVLDSCQGSLNSNPDKKSKISQQIRGMAAILIFQSAEKQKLGRGGCDFASCQVSLNSIQRL